MNSWPSLVLQFQSYSRMNMLVCTYGSALICRGAGYVAAQTCKVDPCTHCPILGNFWTPLQKKAATIIGTPQIGLDRYLFFLSTSSVSASKFKVFFKFQNMSFLPLWYPSVIFSTPSNDLSYPLQSLFLTRTAYSPEQYVALLVYAHHQNYYCITTPLPRRKSNRPPHRSAPYILSSCIPEFVWVQIL